MAFMIASTCTKHTDAIHIYIYIYIYKANEGTEPSSLKLDFLIACGPCQVDAAPDGQMMVATRDSGFGGGGDGGGGEDPDANKIARILKEAASKGYALEVNLETGQLQKKAPTQSLLMFDPVSKMWVCPHGPDATMEAELAAPPAAAPATLEDPPGLLPLGAKAAPAKAAPPWMRPPGMPPMMPPPTRPPGAVVPLAPTAPAAVAPHAAVPDPPLAPLAPPEAAPPPLAPEHDAGHAGVPFPPADAGGDDSSTEDHSVQSWQEDWMRHFN